MKKKLEKYWKFFSERTFEKDVTLEFFKDGSFTVVNKNARGAFKNVMEFYNDNCNLVGTLRGNDLRTLANGTTISVEEDKIIIAAQDANPMENIVSLPYEKGTRVFSSGSLLVVRDAKSNSWQVYNVGETFVPLFFCEICDKVVSFEASDDSNVFAISYEAFNQKDKWLLYYNGETKTFDDCYRIDVLGCGSYIEHNEECSKLYNTHGKILYLSDDTWGIRPIGHSHISFENEFIASALNVGLIAKMKKDVIMVHPKEFIFTTYTVRNYVGDTGYMLKGKSLPYTASSRFDENLIVVYQQGTFFPFYDNIEEVIEGFADDIYELRMIQLHPGKETELYPNNWCN